LKKNNQFSGTRGRGWGGGGQAHTKGGSKGMEGAGGGGKSGKKGGGTQKDAEVGDSNETE